MTSLTATARASLSTRQAVDRLREVIDSEFAAYTAVDRQSGELARPDARSLFAALPAVTPATTPEEIIEHGLVPTLPQNLKRALELPRYRIGRELFVRAQVNHRVADKQRPVGQHDSTGPVAFTHRATLRGQSGDQFVVDVDNAPAPMTFAKTDVYTWNEPIGVAAAGGALSGVQVDYNDPLLKAHICAGFLAIAPDIGKLDLVDANAAIVQARLIHRIASRVRMTYVGRGEGYSGPRAGALLSGGQGVCFVQRAVAGALLAPVSRLLAFDLQVAIGRTLRQAVPHGFLVVTLRPSLTRYVVDPAWGEPLTDLRVAFFGPSWGHDRRLEGFEGAQEVRVRADAVDLPELKL